MLKGVKEFFWRPLVYAGCAIMAIFGLIMDVMAGVIVAVAFVCKMLFGAAVIMIFAVVFMVLVAVVSVLDMLYRP